MEVIRIEEVKEANRKHGFYYFSRDAMQFFSSRVSDRAYKVGTKAYFITSEKNKHSIRGGHTDANPRKWSIRVIDLITGRVNTVGQFQEFNSKREAKKQLERLLDLRALEQQKEQATVQRAEQDWEQSLGIR